MLSPLRTPRPTMEVMMDDLKLYYENVMFRWLLAFWNFMFIGNEFDKGSTPYSIFLTLALMCSIVGFYYFYRWIRE